MRQRAATTRLLTPDVDAPHLDAAIDQFQSTLSPERESWRMEEYIFSWYCWARARKLFQVFGQLPVV